MARNEYRSPQNRKIQEKQSLKTENAENMESLLSPRFKSAAAMAGWDEETLLLASLIVEDTPERDTKHKRRASQQFKTPPTNSRRKRRAQRQNPSPIPVGIINLDDSDNVGEADGNEKKFLVAIANEEKKGGEGSLSTDVGVSSSNSTLPCMDRLREELSCAICLEICFKPSTTTCGHSFCKKCLKSAADKCGKRCPKCRQLISNGRPCTVNTVLWNTIQLLFPDEIEERKMVVTHAREAKQKSPKNGSNNMRDVDEDSAITSGNYSRRRTRRASTQVEEAATSFRNNNDWRRTRRGPSQEEDAALAFRLQREEFMEAFGGEAHHQPTIDLARANFRDDDRTSINIARANLRAMASRAIGLRARRR